MQPNWTPIRRACNPAKLWCKLDAVAGRLQFKDGHDRETVTLAEHGIAALTAGVQFIAYIPGVGMARLRVTKLENDGTISTEYVEPQEG